MSRVRWLFLLLLLMNVVFFVWQARPLPTPAPVVALPAGVERLRLLSEVDATLLLPRTQSESLSVPASVLPGASDVPVRSGAVSAPTVWCQVVSGLDSERAALELRDRLAAQGLTATIDAHMREAMLAFELIVDRPLVQVEDVALLDNLSRLGLRAEAVSLNDVPAYVVGRYGSRTEVDQALARLVGLLAPRIYQVVSKKATFQVWVEVDETRETSNEINLVASILPRGIKIEKKVCKGVASTGGRD